MTTWVVDADLRRFMQLADNVDVSSYVSLANALVDDELNAASITSERKSRIALMLAAHYYSIGVQQGGLKRLRIGESEETYLDRSVDVQGLNATIFGQQAIALDSSGNLADMTNTSTRAVFRVL